MQSPIKHYFERVGIALSILFNTLTGGPSNQTFSARNYGWKREGRYNLVYIIDLLYYYDPNHCMESWVWWYTRRDIQHELTQKIMESEYERLRQGYPHGL